MSERAIHAALIHWYVKGTVMLPQDEDSVLACLKLLAKIKKDPTLYEGPADVFQKHGDITLKEKPINPKDLKELTKIKTIGRGKEKIDIYRLEDSDEGHRALREIVNTHFGKSFNEWCVTRIDPETGDLTERSLEFFSKHYRGPKALVFINGKFKYFATRNFQDGQYLFWDKTNKSHYEIQVKLNVNEYKYELYTINDKLKSNLIYTLEWNKDKTIQEMIKPNGMRLIVQKWQYNEKGELHGEIIETDYKTITISNYVNGKKHGEEIVKDTEDTIISKAEYSNGKLDGIFEEYYFDSVHLRKRYKDGELDGKYQEYEDGSLVKECYYKDGKLHGSFYSREDREEVRANYKDTDRDWETNYHLHIPDISR